MINCYGILPFEHPYLLSLLVETFLLLCQIDNYIPQISLQPKQRHTIVNIIKGQSVCAVAATLIIVLGGESVSEYQKLVFDTNDIDLTWHDNVDICSESLTNLGGIVIEDWGTSGVWVSFAFATFDILQKHWFC